MARPRKPFAFLKPQGSLAPRVEQVGPQHFGVVVVDCGKAQSKFAFSDFFGSVLLAPFYVQHTTPILQDAFARIRQAAQQHHIRDLVVGIEMTGTYHRPVLRAFQQFTDFDTRLLHPHTTKHFRQPADPSNKTDNTDLAAEYRAACLGFGLCLQPLPDLYVQLQAIRRHRRDLVDKSSYLQCQIREVLHETMPGFAELFCHLWESRAPLTLARQANCAADIARLGFEGLKAFFERHLLHVRADTLHKILHWTQVAAPAHPQPELLRLRLRSLDDDHQAKSREINDLETQLAGLVMQTPYALLLAIPGINVVTCADLAGELGPITLYPNPNSITGRAGLWPSRYQSDLVDHPNGPLVQRGNRRIRAVLVQTGDNLLHCNSYFKALGGQWRARGKSPVACRVKAAKVLSRLLYNIVSSKKLRSHPCLNENHYILGKLIAFLVEHHASPEQLRQCLDACITHFLPETAQRETPPLQHLLDDLARRRRGPEPIGNVIRLILARLCLIQSEQERDSR
jgi:transposase